MSVDKVNEILHNIRHLKADLQQLEARQRVQLSSIKKTYSEIKIVKSKIKNWSDRLAGFQTYK